MPWATPFFLLQSGTCLFPVLMARRNCSKDLQRNRRSGRFFSTGEPYVYVRAINKKSQTKSAHKRFSERSWLTSLNQFWCQWTRKFLNFVRFLLTTEHKMIKIVITTTGKDCTDRSIWCVSAKLFIQLAYFQIQLFHLLHSHMSRKPNREIAIFEI